MEVVICKNNSGVEIFDMGAVVVYPYKFNPELIDKSENEILEMYLEKLL